jgi:hypothetical protein
MKRGRSVDVILVRHSSDTKRDQHTLGDMRVSRLKSEISATHVVPSLYSH